MTRRRGFSLVEVIISLVIFSAVILSLVGLSFQVAKRSSRATDQALLMSVLLAKVDEVATVPFDSLDRIMNCDTTASGLVQIRGCTSLISWTPKVWTIRVAVETSVPGTKPDTIVMQRSDIPQTAPNAMTRARGFSLTELIVALVIAGVIGIALSRLVINQARFVGTQDGMMQARGSARAAMNMLGHELREISWGGIIAATPDSIDVRIPYAFGIACGYASGNTVTALLSPDSADFVGASSTHSGYAWLDATNTWIFVEPGTRTGGSNAICYTAVPPVTVLYSPSGAAWAVDLAGNAPPVGANIYLYQKIRYAFAPSVQLPGREALWRTTLGNGTREELVAPLDTATKFNFLVGIMLTPRTAAPAILDSIHGIKVRLIAQSEAIPQGRTVPLLFRVTSDIVFRNHAN